MEVAVLFVWENVAEKQKRYYSNPYAPATTDHTSSSHDIYVWYGQMNICKVYNIMRKVTITLFRKNHENHKYMVTKINMEDMRDFRQKVINKQFVIGFKTWLCSPIFRNRIESWQIRTKIKFLLTSMMTHYWILSRSIHERLSSFLHKLSDFLHSLRFLCSNAEETKLR